MSLPLRPDPNRDMNVFFSANFLFVHKITKTKCSGF